MKIGVKNLAYCIKYIKKLTMLVRGLNYYINSKEKFIEYNLDSIIFTIFRFQCYSAMLNHEQNTFYFVYFDIEYLTNIVAHSIWIRCLLYLMWNKIKGISVKLKWWRVLLFEYVKTWLRVNCVKKRWRRQEMMIVPNTD